LLSSTVRTLAACRYIFIFAGSQEKARTEPRSIIGGPFRLT
jgi:hypothetical protein